MTTAKRGPGRKSAVRMRRLRAIRRKKRDDAKAQETKRQVAILLKSWLRQGIVEEQEKLS